MEKVAEEFRKLQVELKKAKNELERLKVESILLNNFQILDKLRSRRKSEQSLQCITGTKNSYERDKFIMICG